MLTFNYPSHREFIFKSPSPSLAFLPDSGPPWAGMHPCGWTREPIINQLLIIYYCLQSPTAIVLFNPQSNPVMWLSHSHFTEETVETNSKAYLPHVHSSWQANGGTRNLRPGVPMPHQNRSLQGWKVWMPHIDYIFTEVRDSSGLSLFSYGTTSSLSQASNLMLIWFLCLSSPLPHSISHEVLSTLLFQCLSNRPFSSISTVTLPVQALAASYMPDDSTM